MDSPSEMLWVGECELEVYVDVPLEMALHVLVVGEVWCPYVAIDFLVLQVHYDLYLQLVMRVM